MLSPHRAQTTAMPPRGPTWRGPPKHFQDAPRRSASKPQYCSDPRIRARPSSRGRRGHHQCGARTPPPPRALRSAPRVSKLGAFGCSHRAIFDFPWKNGAGPAFSPGPGGCSLACAAFPRRKPRRATDGALPRPPARACAYHRCARARAWRAVMRPAYARVGGKQCARKTGCGRLQRARIFRYFVIPHARGGAP